MQPAAILSVLVVANTGPASRSLMRFNAGLKGTEASSFKATRAIGSFAKVAAIGAAGVAGASVKMAADFEKSMRNVNAIAELPEKSFKRLNKQVLAMAGPTAQAPKTLADGLYDVVSSGFKAGDALKILRAGAKAATAGMTDTAVATQAVTAVLNAYHRPAEDARQVSDDLFQTVKVGVLTFEELSSTIGDVLPFAAQLGVDLKGVGAAVSTMTKAGINAPETMTRIKNVMVALFKPSETLKKSFKELGVEGGQELIKKMGGGTVGFQRSLEAIVNTTLKAGDLTKAYKKLGVDGFDELKKKTGSTSQANAELATTLSANGAAVAKLFPNIRALGGALALTGNNTKGAENDLKSFAKTAGVTDKTFREQMKSFSNQMRQLKVNAEVLAITFGTKLLPPLNRFAKQISEVLSDKTLSGAEKLNKIGEILNKAIDKAGPVVAKAAGKLGLIMADAFVHAWLGAPIWLRILAGGWLLSKAGGIAKNFRALGLVSGAEMGKGVTAGTATGMAGFKGKMGGILRGLGMGALIASIVGPDLVKNVGQGLKEAFGGAKTGFQVKVDAAVDLVVFKRLREQVLSSKTGVAGLRAEFDKLNHTQLTPSHREQLLKLAQATGRVENEFGRMRSGAVLDVKELRAVTQSNFKNIAELMGTNTARGQAAVQKNFRLSLGIIREFRNRGVINVAQAGKEIAHLMGSNTARGKDALASNMLKAERAIAATMSKSGKITQQGTDLIRALMVNAMKNMGLSPDTIRMSLNKRESAKKGPVTPGQTGLVVTGGKPHGDSVHALLERGEVVVNRKAVQKLGGPEKVNRLNQMIPRFQTGGIAGMVGAANQLERAHFPYLWGGGHQGSPAPFGPMDCSGAVSFVLQHGGVQIPTMTSGLLAGAGQAGPGKVTVFANSGHTFMRIGNRYFGTSGSNPEGGAGWFPDPGAAYKSGFAQRHFAAAGGALEKVPRLTVDAPDSMVKTMVQGALDKTRAGANKKLRGVAASAFGGGDAGDPGPLGLGGSPAKNLRLGKKMAASYGWVKGQWDALKDLWNRESGWSNTARNPSSGAFGIPQALPPTKMPKLAQEGDAASQIAWGLQYIKGRYGSPGAALAFHNANNWYAKGGVVGYVGDSLGVGTVPKLRGLIDRKIEANTVSGRSSSSGVSALNGLLKKTGKGKQFVFDLGTNDGSAAQVSSSLSSFDRMTGKGNPLHALTLLGPDAGKKNAALRARAGGDINLIDWAKVAGQYVKGDPQHIHPDGTGYQRRAQMVASAIKRARESEVLTKGQKRQIGKAGHGPLGKQFAQTIKTLRKVSTRTKFGRLLRNKRVDSLTKKLKGFGVLPGHLDEKISILTKGVDEYGDYADRAGQLSVDNEDGTTTLGMFRGNDEQGWLKAQLSRMFALRNFLADAQKIIEQRRTQMAKFIKQVRAMAARVQEQIKSAAERKDALEKRLKQLKKNPKVNRKLIDRVSYDLKRTKQGQQDRVRTRKDLTKVLGGLNSRYGSEGLGGALTTNSEALDTIQGIGGPRGRLKTLPALGALGGTIFDVQLRLRDLAAPKTAITDAASGESDTGQADLLAQLLREANLRTAVSQRQYDVFKNFDATSGFMGAFAKGGVALVGERGPELAHLPSGTRVHSASDTQSMLAPNVSVHVYEGEGRAEVFINDRKIDAAVERVTRRQSRNAGRRLPGRGGGG